MLYQGADTFGMTPYFELVNYILFLIYIKIQFKSNWISSMIKYALCIIITALLQLVCYLPVALWPNQLLAGRSFVVNILLFIIIFIIYKSKILTKISQFLNQRNKVIIILLAVTFAFVVMTLYSMQKFSKLWLLDGIILVISIIVLFSLLYLLLKEKMLNHQMETEKTLSLLYGNTMMELIDKVRINQHNYHNHLTTIQGMICTANSLEELQEEQQKYYKGLQQEERYYKIISGNNDPIIAGFLYAKLSDLDREDIAVEYALHIDRIENSLFVADLIKILGVLIDNAFEEIIKDEYTKKCIYISVSQKENLQVEVRNICKVISTSAMADFFKKGHSTKGEDRGLGLFSVKEMSAKWHGEITPQNIVIEDENWFSISITFPQ